MKIEEHRLKGVYQAKQGKKKTLLFTKNLTPGTKVYQERLIKTPSGEYREWEANKSKLGAAIKNNISQTGIKPGSVVLYLGSGSGTTPSHVSDIVGREGFIFALDFAPRVVRDLVFVCEDRKNMAPILGDAARPDSFAERVCQADVIFQDIAQADQVEILIKNADKFLKKDGFAILAVKSRSIDVTRKPKDVFKEVRAKLEKRFRIADYRDLAPFEKDHCLFVCKN